MVSKVCRRLGHPSTCTGGTDPAALARKRHQKTTAAACALCPRKPKAVQHAGQIPTKLFFNMPPEWPAGLVVLGKPALKMLGDVLIERRLLRPSTGITNASVFTRGRDFAKVTLAVLSSVNGTVCNERAVFGYTDLGGTGCHTAGYLLAGRLRQASHPHARRTRQKCATK